MSTLFVDDVSIVVAEDNTLGGGVSDAELDAEIAARIAADLLLIPKTEKGAPDGVAPLDGNALVPTQYLPPLSVSGQTFSVSSEAEMLALDADPGATAVRSDLDPDGFFFLATAPASTLSNWIQILSPGTVLSVDGRTGTVSLSDLYDPLGSYQLAPAYFSKAGTIQVARGKSPEPITSDRTIASVVAVVDTAPVGADLILELMRNGVAELTITIADGSIATEESGVFIDLFSGDILTLDVVQVGSSVAGWDLTVKVLYAARPTSGPGWGSGPWGNFPWGH